MGPKSKAKPTYRLSCGAASARSAKAGLRHFSSLIEEHADALAPGIRIWEMLSKIMLYDADVTAQLRNRSSEAMYSSSIRPRNAKMRHVSTFPLEDFFRSLVLAGGL